MVIINTVWVIIFYKYIIIIILKYKFILEIICEYHCDTCDVTEN